MKYGISNLSIIPVRAEAKEQSEMITQILFGETFKITSTRKNWCHIIIDNDNYEGWIDKKLCNQISEEFYLKHLNNKPIILSDMLSAVHEEKSKYPHFICAGSELPFFNETDNSFLLADKKYFLLNDTFDNKQTSIKETAYIFLNSPYLWGGKTNFGIDCSGFTQTVFKINGIKIPRDASQQVELGKTLNFMNEAKLGDLAFFDNDEGNIVHVGIILNQNKIIHASGKVRIDTIDFNGIFNNETKSYSHKLRVIKRIL